MPRSVFVCYSGDRDRMALLVDALRRHGMQPWRDAESLPAAERTVDDIRRELADCRAALIWLSRQTLGSAFVTTVELPTIIDEHEQRGLRILPVFVGWKPGEAVDAVRAAVGREIGDYNGHVLDATLPLEQEVVRIAARYANTLLTEAAGAGERPIIRCVTRSDAAANRDRTHVNLDWRAEYPSDGTLPSGDTVSELGLALGRVADLVIGAFGAGSADVQLRCHLHVAVALGHALRRPTGILPRVRVDDGWWSAGRARTGSGEPLRQYEAAAGPADANRASVEVSISREVGPGVDRTVATTGTRYACRIKLSAPAGPHRDSVPGETTANRWAEQIAGALMDVGNRPGIDQVDLFLSCPPQLGVLLGWRLNAAGSITLHHWERNAGPYVPVWRLPPS